MLGVNFKFQHLLNCISLIYIAMEAYVRTVWVMLSGITKMASFSWILCLQINCESCQGRGGVLVRHCSSSAVEGLGQLESGMVNRPQLSLSGKRHLVSLQYAASREPGGSVPLS